jgi:hypothetical protein
LIQNFILYKVSENPLYLSDKELSFKNSSYVTVTTECIQRAAHVESQFYIIRISRVTAGSLEYCEGELETGVSLCREMKNQNRRESPAGFAYHKCRFFPLNGSVLDLSKRKIGERQRAAFQSPNAALVVQRLLIHVSPKASFGSDCDPYFGIDIFM